jgi:hypothetical protein
MPSSLLQVVIITAFIIYQYAKSHFSSVLLVEGISRESDEIDEQQRERETIRYRPANNEKNHVRHHVKMRPLDIPNNLKQLYNNYNITI